jgi:hypothetical protein
MKQIAVSEMPSAQDDITMKNELFAQDALSGTLSGSVREPRRRQSGKGIEQSRAGRRIAGVLIGRLTDLVESGAPRVEFPGNPSPKPRPALSVLKLTKDTVGREVVLMFEEGDPLRPVVMGIVEERGVETREPVELTVDSTKIVFKAEHEIVLRCGEASITLTRAGKVLIRGAYVLNHSSGVNRIKGGSVQIN